METCTAGDYSNIELPPASSSPHAFSDADAISSCALDGVNAMYGAGIMTGKPDNNFDPKGNVTRAEIAVIFERFMTSYL
ncbi:MAG: S-layer homology domain-containing protein [Oscillospiraceae bacterium]